MNLILSSITLILSFAGIVIISGEVIFLIQKAIKKKKEFKKNKEFFEQMIRDKQERIIECPVEGGNK